MNIKKILPILIFCLCFFQGVNSSENDIYKKIDLFGEVFAPDIKIIKNKNDINIFFLII